MKIKFMVAATLMAALVTTTSCGNSNKQSQSEKTEQAAPAALSIDNLLVHADSLANKEVTIEGICTHTCKHGATKIFLMGSDDTKTIRVEAGPLGSFDTKCINAIVTVTGTLKEQRVDEAYLQNWEAKLKAQTEKSHGAQGCDRGIRHKKLPPFQAAAVHILALWAKHSNAKPDPMLHPHAVRLTQSEKYDGCLIGNTSVHRTGTGGIH